jgi:hypothetical protein
VLSETRLLWSAGTEVQYSTGTLTPKYVVVGGSITTL